MTNSQLDKTNYRLMKVKSISECSYLFIKLPFVINIFVLSIFEWLFYTVLIVFQVSACMNLFLIMLLDNKLVVVKRVKAYNFLIFCEFFYEIKTTVNYREYIFTIISDIIVHIS